MPIAKDKSNKVSTSVKLTPSVVKKLEVVCEELGINPHAYMCAEIGKAVQRDYLAYYSKQVLDNQSNQMLEIFQSVISDIKE